MRSKPVGVLLLLALAAAGGLILFRPGRPPSIELATALPAVGQEGTAVTVHLAEPSRGLGSWRLEALQGERSVTLAERRHRPRPMWKPWAERLREETVEVAVGPATVEGLAEGSLTLRVTAERAPAVLRHPRPVVVERSLPVRLTPPALTVVSRPNYVTQGGSGVVVYRVGEEALATGGRDGVEVDGWFFPGAPLPSGAAGERFALFGVPYDLEDGAGVRLVAVDGLGNSAALPFLDRFFTRPLPRDTIRLSDAFLERVVPEILAHTPGLEDRGELLASYLEINGALRQENGAELRRLGATSRQELLWRGAFVQLPGSQVTSSFADRRTYLYGGEEVDHQDHLGFDLASVRRAPVPAANRGVVVLARYFGIYGNTVVLDHGHGLMSLYAHLSSIAVEEGQTVARGEELGRTGETGLAGGDHLHFTLLMGGLPVSPLEWWDAGWIRHRVAEPLGLDLGVE